MLCSYYRRFIQGFVTLLGPLYELTKKKVKYEWTSRHQEDFAMLKEKLISKPVTILLDLSKPFGIQCDACGDCLGSFLLQYGYVIAYESFQLHKQERVFGTCEKDLLAIINTLLFSKHYLLGTPFIIQMDHQSIRYFMTQTKLFDKQIQWEIFYHNLTFLLPIFLASTIK